jgi:hypothetical protein
VIALSEAVAAGATLAITFPSEYSATTLRSHSPYSGNDAALGDACYFTQPFRFCTPTLSYSGSTFFLSGIFGQSYDPNTDSFFLQYSILNVANPDVLAVGTFEMTIYQGSTIYYPSALGSSGGSLTFSPSTMAYSTSVQTGTIRATSTLIITLTPDTLIDTLSFSFPSTWTNETVISSAVFGSPVCSSSSNPTTSCSVVGVEFLASNLNYYTPSQPIVLTLHSIYNPSALTTIGSIGVSGRLGGTTKTTASISIPGSSFTYDIPRTMTTSVSYQAGDLFDVNIYWRFPYISNSGDKVVLAFPSELAMPVGSGNYDITGSNTLSMPLVTFASGNNSLSFLPFNGLGIFRASLNITIRNIPRPRECKTTSNFAIESYRESLYLMDLGSCCGVQLTNRQTLTSSAVQLSSPARLQTPVTYTFSLTTVRVNLLTTDALLIEFPA